MEMVPVIHRPPAGKMVIAVSPDGSAHPLPQMWISLPNDPLGGIERAAQSSYPGSRIEFVDEQPLEGLAPGKRAEWRDGLVIEDDADKLAAHRAMLARDELKRSDYIGLKGSEEDRIISDEWKAWRVTLRAIANGSGAEIPAMPYPWAPISNPQLPEHHFADLMLADETLDDAKARLSQRLRELRHYLMAPEIRVNEDGSLGLTAGEQAELQDLERRQTLGRWLEA
jgi:hypothetical protein